MKKFVDFKSLIHGNTYIPAADNNGRDFSILIFNEWGK